MTNRYQTCFLAIVLPFYSSTLWSGGSGFDAIASRCNAMASVLCVQECFRGRLVAYLVKHKHLISGSDCWATLSIDERFTKTKINWLHAYSKSIQQYCRQRRYSFIHIVIQVVDFMTIRKRWVYLKYMQMLRSKRSYPLIWQHRKWPLPTRI